MDTLFGPREKASPASNPNLEKKFIAVAKTDDSGLVRLALASSLQRMSLSSRLDLAKALVTHAEDGADHNLPMIVWAGILPLVEQNPGGLSEVARATTWPSLRTWIARAMTERSEEQPEIFDTLLDLLIEQPTEADSLLAGMERAILGIDQYKKPKKWDRVRNKLPQNPTVLKLSVIFGDPEATQEMKKVVLDPKANPVNRRQTLDVLIESDFPQLKSLCEILLPDPEMQGIAARGLSRFEDWEVGKKLVDQLDEFSVEEQNELVEILCGRPNWAGVLLDKIEQGRISKSVLSPYHASQIQALADEELNRKLAAVWGVIRSTPAGLSKRKEELKQELNTSHLANANLSKGRNLYQQQCSSCHVLYGEGGKLGPDLTGSGRTNLDYLLENIVDPNSVVSSDYRMNVIELQDGRVLSGMIAGQDRNSLTLRMPGSDTVLSKAEIKKRQTLENSIMPAGLLDHLERDQRRDLVAYLMHPVQVQ
jgi:putative heme-binding domain-containing protein